MRTSYQRPVSKSNNSLPWKWIGVIAIIVFIFWFSSHFWKNDPTSSGNSLLEILPGTGSEVYTIDIKGVKKQMSDTFSLQDEGSSISIVNGTAEARNTKLDGFIDKASEITYKKTWSIDALGILRGRIWIESKEDLTIQLKNIDLTLKKDDVVFVEQNQVYSTLYVFHGIVPVRAGSFSYAVDAGKRIMVAHSDILNPSLSLENLSGPIDDSIKQNPFFIARNGEQLLSDASKDNSASGWLIGSGEILSGTLTSSGNALSNHEKFIEIVTPQDGSSVTTQNVKITGKLLSKEVKKVTMNESNATVSPVDATFSYTLTITEETTNIVYKAYGSDGNLLERGVLTLYSKESKKGIEKLSPNNFPIADKNYRIMSPSENPYKTTESNVTVQWVVPKDTVNYIMVNNFRLKQFKPYGTNWYYYANMTYSTMKDGINLYEIRFYGSNDELLSTQLFTIVKEPKVSTLVSWETR